MNINIVNIPLNGLLTAYYSANHPLGLPNNVIRVPTKTRSDLPVLNLGVKVGTAYRSRVKMRKFASKFLHEFCLIGPIHTRDEHIVWTDKWSSNSTDYYENNKN